LHFKLSAACAQRLGIKEIDESVWLVSFFSNDLGLIDLKLK